MRVLFAPDSFTGTLSAGEAATAMAEGWRRQAPDDDLRLCPLSAGGPGFVDVLAASLPGRQELVTVPGPLGEPTPAQVLLVRPEGIRSAPVGPASVESGSVESASVESGSVGPASVESGSVESAYVESAYVESAQACGLHLVPPGRRDPGRTTTLGVAGLLLAARAAGASRIVVGLGGSGTNDAGAGMLAGLLRAAAGDGGPREAGGVDADVLGRLAGGGEGLRGITAPDLAALPALRQEWADVEIVVASDVDVPLLGLHGTSAASAERKGATPEQAQRLEAALADFAAAACDAAGLPRTLARAAGAGAAGGLGFALALLGGRPVAGADGVLDAVRFRQRVEQADLVVTGEGTFDWQSLRGRVVSAVAAAALEVGRPVIVVAGQVLVGRREALSIGVESAYAVAEDPTQVAAALADPAGSLAARTRRVARTWSPSR